MADYQLGNEVSCPIRGEKNKIIALDSIQFDSDDERRRYLISEFPRLVKEGSFVQAMGLVNGNTSLNWFFAILNKSLIWLTKKLERLLKRTKKTEYEPKTLLRKPA